MEDINKAKKVKKPKNIEYLPDEYNYKIKGYYRGHSTTVIQGQGPSKYGNTLQEVNDRINSFRPNTITNYKISGDEQTIVKLRRQQLIELLEWDGKSWNEGEYTSFGDPKEPASAKLFYDFKTLAKSSAAMRGLLNINKVRGGTAQDVDDFLNYVVLKMMERRQKMYDKNSSCRILDNWLSHLAMSIPQYLILFNKSKIDYEIETFWPMIKDDKTGEMVPKDFGIDPEFSKGLVNQRDFEKLLDLVISSIPEAKGLEIDILYNLIYGVPLSHKGMVNRISHIVKFQLYSLKEEILIEL